ncbi:hypothetical protein Cgig2_018959 [Carnegiea gigantea]|uniref:DNA2/NAM7 helicase-like C-terminal domain-containing protein n=1 Tax=Carnegiea gigantea TaxID=171969 RepID=A0A9Q1GJB9_9CARY|nr:hypothetical protein Cgig2_018959 [Carnegiea gigantea]
MLEVGDPVQLPATVISPLAENLEYGMSLFKRFQRAGYPVFMPKTQYRMHPESLDKDPTRIPCSIRKVSCTIQIRSFPSQEFYNDALGDGSDVKKQTKRAWQRYRCFGPFCFFDMQDGKESQPAGSGSWINVDEVEFVLLVYQKLVAKYPELKSSDKLAIISPCRHQVKLFLRRFQEMFGIESEKVVDINTVDGFQGWEKDVAILSCVRASKDKGIGFVSDFRRMNVGITRARSSVLVVGSASTLRKDQHWSNLVESAEKSNGFFQSLIPNNGLLFCVNEAGMLDTNLHRSWHVTKPYAKFLGDDFLEKMAVEEKVVFEEAMEEDETHHGDVTNVDPGLADENYYRDGDMDMGIDDD